MLAVIDYGASNLRSVVHALNYLQVDDMRIVRTPHELRHADKIILPGVGAFGAGMQQLHKQGLVGPLKDAVYAGIPYLGICLGMQFLFETSDEMGNHPGLGILPGSVVRFPKHPDYKVPHMGWNQLRQRRPSPLLNKIDPENAVYFVHSYYCAPANPDDIVATVDYGIDFTAVVQRSSVYGVQFHPEKSQRTGLQVLTNFLEMSA
jgi:glutamine amidotransferase